MAAVVCFHESQYGDVTLYPHVRVFAGRRISCRHRIDEHRWRRLTVSGRFNTTIRTGQAALVVTGRDRVYIHLGLNLRVPLNIHGSEE